MILDHQQVAPDHFKITLKSTYIPAHAKPGQFVQVRCTDTIDPLLRRPLGIHKVAKDQFELLYEVVGRGTELLSQRKIGEKVDVLGPLGNGFNLDSKKTAIIIAGGMGVAPLLYVAQQITNYKLPITDYLQVFIGANTKKKVLCEKDFKKLTDKVMISTDDGSYANKGYISDILFRHLEENREIDATIYACGPKPMLKEVADIAFQKKLECQVSMEARMACGIGTCLGCVIKTTKGYQKVCDDGPVFDSKEIIWTV